MGFATLKRTDFESDGLRKITQISVIYDISV